MAGRFAKRIMNHYTFGSVDINVVFKFKLLGVVIDSKLSFVDNVEQTCKKVRAALFSMKSKFFLTLETKQQFFKTSILPHFDYCISLVIYYSKNLRMTLVNLYNFCLRKLAIVRLAKFEHIRDIDSVHSLRQHSLFSYECRVFLSYCLVRSQNL